ncbi:hypothetical protein [Bradyrhizobium sp. LHD-71]|uniref:hypothetical protein n=1 Tax=Bradyrhizobium sp. LHD-71 TaxID=3072141 RepID=UPI00281067D1|nr:hypothetical protein [Bradyrhizobium sp. LHD-71]MDQ8729235.1 hypothetical protein [Bradyrhizobium sp. LHD-71]
MRIALAAHAAEDGGYAETNRAGDDHLRERTFSFDGRRRLGAVRSESFDVKRRALLVVLAGWLALLGLAAIQSVLAGRDVLTSMLMEIGLHARYLIAAPLLVLAVAWCVPRLNAIEHYFIDSGIVSERDHGHFDQAIAATHNLLQSRTAKAIAIALAYVVVLATTLSHAPDQLPYWARPVAGVPRYSLAGWWHMLVSLPLLLVLIFGWFWRLAMWARLLSQISRLELRLLASHPDRCAGLSFLGQSVRAFAIAALALAVIIAGRFAQLVLTGGGLPTPDLGFNVAALLAIAVLFVAPLLVFTPTLIRARQQGVLAYDALAQQVGYNFERRHLNRGADQIAPEAPDVSAVADLSSVLANVHAMRFIPLDLKDLALMAVALLLPFIPAVLLAFPINVIWAQIKSLLL